MNGGQACGMENTGAMFHADVRGLCGGVGADSEPPPSSGREDAPTRAYTDAYADTLASPMTLEGDRAHWCVDTGGPIATMTTFELWEALERGQVAAWMRVWREGMECWTAVGEISEFTWAIAGTPPPAEPAAAEPPAEARTSPPQPATVTVRSLDPEAPPESGIQPRPKPRPGARWIALGSAVAIAAVVAALFVQKEAPAKAPAASPGAAAPAEAAMILTPLAPAPSFADDGVTHAERGQRRLPRGGKRAYGR